MISFRAGAIACLHPVLMLSVSLLLPTSVNARLISEDSRSPGFPSDPAFAAGSLLVPLDNLALSPRDQSFSITVGGIQFHFETLSSRGLTRCTEGVPNSCGLWTLDSFPVVLTITPPVAVVGLTLGAVECSGRATFVGALAPLSYSIDVANLGRDTARSATTIDFLPRGVTVQSTSPGATLQPPLAPNIITWS